MGMDKSSRSIRRQIKVTSRRQAKRSGRQQFNQQLCNGVDDLPAKLSPKRKG